MYSSFPLVSSAFGTAGQNKESRSRLSRFLMNSSHWRNSQILTVGQNLLSRDSGVYRVALQLGAGGSWGTHSAAQCQARTTPGGGSPAEVSGQKH